MPMSGEDIIRHIDARFDRLDAKIDIRVTQLDTKLEGHVEKLHQRIDQTDTKAEEARVDTALTKGKLIGIGIPLAIISGWMGNFLKAIFER